MRTRDAVRFGYGVALLVDPDHAAQALAGTRLDRRARTTARVLGARHVAQSVLLVADDRVLTRSVGRVVDLLHAGSMLLLAALSPGRVRVTLTDAAITALLADAKGEPRSARPPTQSPNRPQQQRSPSPEPRPHRSDLPVAPHALDVDVLEDDETADARIRRQQDARRQEAVYEAFQTARGSTPDHARAALVRALEARGLALPPDPWLDAVAADLANGNIYVVSGPAMRDVGLDLPPHEPL